MYAFPLTPTKPAKWRDLAECVERLENDSLVNSTCEISWGLNRTRGWCSNVCVRLTPSVFSPWYGKRREIVIVKQAFLNGNYSLSNLIWSAYWEASHKATTLWPIGEGQQSGSGSSSYYDDTLPKDQP